ncbi:hypothetical protein [Allorhizocola rhizosphaerae]|uniref:hypothetical protein n=1 Tax=Allorhizocola rhizosphaerae TaxID=1872709 RepID=UPI000E3BDF6B|nr:hypothetical protein [Allorhizocola rhizosphaerae]
MERLPYVDEHAVPVSASRDAVWSALTHVLHRTMTGSVRLARLLGTEPASATPTFGGRPGETVPGFRVVHAEPGRQLTLQGRHRFSRYRLTFLLDDDRLRAQTHAAFPGPHGKLYRAAVITSGAHRIMTRRMLRQVEKRVRDTDRRRP